jgi:DNA polymerase-3 subunit epsilon
MQTIMEFYNEQIKDFEDLSFEDRREAALQLQEIKNHTKVTLKTIFRMKPSKVAVSEYRYKNSYSQVIECFTIKQCVPMRPLSSKARTVAQIETAKKLALVNQVNSKHNKTALMALQMINDDLVIIDTETTDLDGVVIQIAAVSAKTSKLLYKSYVTTNEEISDGAYQVHGITKDALEGAPTFKQVAHELKSIIQDRKWSAFNLDFDDRAMLNSLPGNYDYKQLRWLKNTDDCIMYLAAGYFGATNRHGSISLADSMYQSGIEWRGDAHDAGADAMAASDVLRYIASKAITV